MSVLDGWACSIRIIEVRSGCVRLCGVRLGGEERGDAVVPELWLGAAGWTCYRNGFDGDLYIRFEELPDGRLVAAELHARSASGQLTGTDLRKISLGQIETSTNSPITGDMLRHRIRNQAEQARVKKQFARLWPEIVAVGTKEAMDGLVELGYWASTKLDIPTTRKKPDAFYEQVANVYAALLNQGVSYPAAGLAEANGVAVTTVHRWIKEARRRGLLPPARRAARKGQEAES